MPIPSFPVRPEDTVQRDAAGIPGATEVRNIVTLSQAAYDALTPVATTLYIVTPNP